MSRHMVKGPMLEWMKKHGWSIIRPDNANVPAVKPLSRAGSGGSGPLYDYLEKRFAETVVLTFAEIEDLLGCALPEQARVQPSWWTGDATSAGVSCYCASWIGANRTAAPNLRAETVAFERV